MIDLYNETKNFLSSHSPSLVERVFPLHGKPPEIYQSVLISCTDKLHLCVFFSLWDFFDVDISCYHFENGAWYAYERVDHLLYRRSEEGKNLPEKFPEAIKFNSDEEEIEYLEQLLKNTEEAESHHDKEELLRMLHCTLGRLLVYGEDMLRGEEDWLRHTPAPPKLMRDFEAAEIPDALEGKFIVTPNAENDKEPGFFRKLLQRFFGF